jgi:hypothetical protein
MKPVVKNALIISGVLLGLVVIRKMMVSKIVSNFLGKPGQLNTTYPRGIRNNNPGNIRKSFTTFWKGALSPVDNTDPAFEQFKTYEYGVRALIKNLVYYISKKGLNTVELIISTYAPAIENDTEAYINRVTRYTGFSRKQLLIAEKATLKKLCKAIILVENGGEYLSDSQFEQAYSMI